MTHYRLPSSPLCVSTSLSSSVSALNSWIQIIRKHFSNGRVKPPPQASLPGLHCPVLENEWEDARSHRSRHRFERSFSGIQRVCMFVGDVNRNGKLAV